MFQTIAQSNLLEDAGQVLSGLPERQGRVRLELTRITELLRRGTALGFSRQRWEGRGVWTLTRADDDYPASWRTALGNRMPPMLFGIGARSLLDRPGLAVAGSRASSSAALSWARDLGRFAAEKGLPLVTGAAPGADTAAFEGAAEAGGEIVIFPARGLLQAARTPAMASGLAEGTALLLAEGGLEPASFVGEAMARNRLIYASSKVAMVVHGVAGRGGTWQGAKECLRQKWTCLWIVDHLEAGSAQSELIEQGALACRPGDWEKILTHAGDGDEEKPPRLTQKELF